jgi:formylglycine-generating enzyme required for sulfatase activity
MLLVPRGEFTMGTDSPEARPRERPPHRVVVDDFYMDRHLVTNSQFERFCQATGYRTTAERIGKGDIYREGAWGWVEGACWRHPLGPASNTERMGDHPVVLVTVQDALAYCAWRAKVERRWFRLPTEAEWEKAARGTDSRHYTWGNEAVDHGGVLRARFNDDQALGTAAVKDHPEGASPYGLLDMAGNAWDWCLDVFQESYYQGAPEVDVGGPFSMSLEGVFRGGSWIFPRDALRSSGRHTNNITRPSAGIGFRTVCPLGRRHGGRVFLRRLSCRTARLVGVVGGLKRRLRGSGGAGS